MPPSPLPQAAPALNVPQAFAEGLRLLEDDALGGGGSRGNGRISFGGLNLIWRGKDYYAKGAAEASLLTGADLAQFQQFASADDLADKLA